MIKDLSLKSKIEFLGPVLGRVLQDIRRDIKQEHLKKDRAFVQKYFGKNHVDKVSAEEIEKAYFTEIVSVGNEELASWVVSKWILKHAELYEYFVTELSKINPRFEEIELLDMDVAKSIAARSVDQFSVIDTYIFSVMNSVAFADEIFHHFKQEVEQLQSNQAKGIEQSEELSLQELMRRHNQELGKLSDRYEKRLQAVSKRYVQDIEGLKKQLAAVQKRLSEKVHC